MLQTNMVTINNNLRKGVRPFILLSLILITFSVNSQKKELLDNFFDRDFQLALFQKRYKQFPSLLEIGNISKFTAGSLRYLQSKGAFKHLQSPKKVSGLVFETSSLAPLKKTNWHLFGALKYSNTRNEDVEMNLSYQIYDYNSPYYFFQGKEGLWNHQSYDFSVIGSNKIAQKWTLGVQLDYLTNFYFRKNDTRNEKTTLDIIGKISATYLKSEKQSFSFAFVVERLKRKSILTDKFQENKNESIYFRYFNIGLGSYLKNIQNGAESLRNIYGTQLQWLYNTINFDFSIQSVTKIGKDKWMNTSISLVDRSNAISNYNFFEQNFTLIYNKYNTNKNYFNVVLDLNYLNGFGSYWDEDSLLFNENYTATQYNTSVAASAFYHNKIIKKLGIKIDYFSRNQYDANFGYQFNNSSVNPQINVGLNKKISRKNHLFSDFKLRYQHNFNVVHKPFAAKNLYVDLIGNPLADFLNVNNIGFYNRIGINKKIGLKNIEVAFTTFYRKPIGDNIGKYKSSDFSTILLDFSYYF
ncbi:MAG: hypothetical protein ACI9JT_000870 [Polaribacter sp.]|jgi:hypothetical protein